MKNYIENNTLYIEVEGNEESKPIVNTAPIVHIKGNGGTLKIITERIAGVAIGAEVWSCSGGRYQIHEKCKLNKLIVDNVNVKVVPWNNAFSLGTYNSSNDVEIVLLNGATLDCPEMNGRSVMLYDAEPPEASTKYVSSPKYVLLKNDSVADYCSEQREAFGDKFDEWSNILSPYYRPKMIKFLIRNNIKPAPDFFDKNVNLSMHDMIEAAIYMGCNPKDVYASWKQFGRRGSLYMELILKEMMYKQIYPGYSNDDKEVNSKLNDGYLGVLYTLGKKDLPAVTEENRRMLMYLLPLADSDTSVEHINDCLIKGFEQGANGFARVCNLAEKDVGKDVDIVHITTSNGVDVYMASSSDIFKGELYIVDNSTNIISKVKCTYVMRGMINMARTSGLEVSIQYLETIVVPTENYLGLTANMTYITTDNLEQQEPELYNKLQSAIEDGKAEYKYDKPVLDLLGIKYSGEVAYRL